MAYLGRKGATAPLTTADIPDGIIVASDLAPDSVDSSELVDGSIDTSHIGANQVTAAKVASDVATTAGTQTLTNKTLSTGSIATAVTGFTGIKNASKWLVTTSFGESSGTNVFDSNWAVVPSTRGYSALGTDMTQSSGVFTFPSTGYWLVAFFCAGRGNSAAPVVTANIETAVNAGSGDTYSAASTGFWYSGGDPTKTHTAVQWLFDVTSTTTHKCRFSAGVTASTFFECSSTILQNGAMFMRLGDT